MTDCTRFEELLASSRLGLLDATEDAATARHARTCSECSQFARALDETLAAAGEANDALPGDVWDRLATEIAEHAAGPSEGAPRITLACTFCHASVTPDEKVFCASCIAPHHAECFEEHGSCSAPGCAERRFVRPELARSQAARPAPRRTKGLVFALVAAGAAGSLAAFTLTSGFEARSTPGPVIDATPLTPPPVEEPRTPGRAPRAERPESLPAERRVEPTEKKTPPGEDAPAPAPAKGVGPSAVERPDRGPDLEIETYRLKPGLSPERTGVERLTGGSGASGPWISPDHSTVAAFTFKGFKLVRGAREVEIETPLLYRRLSFSPDSSRIAAWLPKGVGVASVEQLFATGSAASFKIVAPMPLNGPTWTLDAQWASSEELVVLERRWLDVVGAEGGARSRSKESRIRLVSISGGDSASVKETDEPIGWFAAARRDGRLDRIVYGTPSSIEVVSGARPFASLGSVPNGVKFVTQGILSPSGTEVALLSNEGTSLRALVHLGRAGSDALEILEFHEVLSVYFSPGGRRIAWISGGKLHARLAHEPDRGFALAAREFGGAMGPPAWHLDDRRIGLVGVDGVFVVDTDIQRAERIANIPSDTVAEASRTSWVGEDLVFTLFRRSPRK